MLIKKEDLAGEQWNFVVFSQQWTPKKCACQNYLFSILSCQQDTVKHLVDVKRKPDELFMVSSKFVPQKCDVSFLKVILDEFSELEFNIVRQ